MEIKATSEVITLGSWTSLLFHFTPGFIHMKVVAISVLRLSVLRLLLGLRCEQREAVKKSLPEMHKVSELILEARKQHLGIE